MLCVLELEMIDVAVLFPVLQVLQQKDYQRPDYLPADVCVFWVVDQHLLNPGCCLFLEADLIQNSDKGQNDSFCIAIGQVDELLQHTPEAVGHFYILLLMLIKPVLYKEGRIVFIDFVTEVLLDSVQQE